MKKRDLKSLKLNKTFVSNLENQTKGGRKYPTFQISECGTCNTDYVCPTWAVCNFTKDEVCQLR